MNRLYLTTLALYVVIAFPLIWLTDLTVNGRHDAQLFRVALYTPIVVSSLITASFALGAVVRESWHHRDVERIITWPPEWDYNVAGWATTKALFFTVLWFYGMGWGPPEWVLTVTLGLFAFAHTMFTAQWLGPGGLEREP